jgi:hypothetical protein
VHFGFAAKFCDALAEGAPIYPDGLAKGVIAFEDRAELEGKNRGITEAGTYDSCVLDCGFLVQFTGCVVVFAHDYREFATWIAKNRSAVNSLYAF